MDAHQHPEGFAQAPGPVLTGALGASSVMPPAPAAPVEGALNDVHASIDRLEAVTQALYDKLSPVLADSEDPSEKPGGNPSRGSSALFHRASHADHRLIDVAAALERLINRVEL